MPVTHGVTGSSPVHTAQSAALKGTFCITGVLVQLVRIHACHAWGHGFESRTHRKTLPKVQCFRKRFALYVIYILAKFKSCFDRLQSGKTQTCKRTQAQALPPNATSNGGDASRVGNFFSSLVSRERCSYYLVECVFPSHFSIPTRDASPPLVIAFGA